MGRVEVLELVDQEVAALGLRGRPRPGVGQQDLDGPVDLLVEIDRAGVGQRGAVAVESLGDARGVGHGLFDQIGGGEPEPDGGEGLEIRGDRVGVGLAADLDVALQQVPHRRLLEDPEPAGRPNSLQIHSPRLFSVRMLSAWPPSMSAQRSRSSSAALLL